MSKLEDVLAELRQTLNKIEQSRECDTNTVEYIITLVKEMNNASTNVSKFTEGYNQGYTAGMIACRDEFERILSGEFAARKKKIKHKQISELFTIILQNRQKIRDRLPGFIRLNITKDEFEWFVKKGE